MDKKNNDRVILLIIDPQNDFHDGGSLAVPNSKEDSERISKMIRENMDDIDEIIITLDSHHVNHIAHACFWRLGEFISPESQEAKIERSKCVKCKMEEGEVQMYQPHPFSTISYEDLIESKIFKNGRWIPYDTSIMGYCLKYVKDLEKQGKFKLTIWPEHCLIGTDGHAVTDSINEVICEWGIKKLKTIKYVKKGMNCLTEMYSAIKAEVIITTDPLTQSNEELLDELFDCKRLIVCGQALSHCVKWTVIDILKDWAVRAINDGHKDKRIYDKKLFLLTDGSSSVGSFEMTCNDFLGEEGPPKYNSNTFDPEGKHVVNNQHSLKNHKATLTTCSRAFHNLNGNN